MTRLPFNRRRTSRKQHTPTCSVFIWSPVSADQKYEVRIPGRPAVDQQFEVCICLPMAPCMAADR